MVRYSALKYDTLVNVLLTVAAVAIVIPQDVVNVIPGRYKVWAILGIRGLAWVNSNRNLFINPNGTPAEHAWAPNNNPAPKP